MSILVVADRSSAAVWCIDMSFHETLQAKGQTFEVVYTIEEAAALLRNSKFSAVLVMDSFALKSAFLDTLYAYMVNDQGLIIFGGDITNSFEIDMVNNAFDKLGFNWIIAASSFVESVINLDAPATFSDNCPSAFSCHGLLVKEKCSNRHADEIIYGSTGKLKGYGTVVLQRDAWDEQPQVSWIGIDTKNKAFSAILSSVLNLVHVNQLPAEDDTRDFADDDYIAGAHDNVQGFEFPEKAGSYIEGIHENAEGYSLAHEQEIVSLRKEISVLREELADQCANTMYWYDMTLAAPIGSAGGW